MIVNRLRIVLIARFRFFFGILPNMDGQGASSDEG